MGSFVQELKNKLSSGSFVFHNSTQDVSLSPDNEAMEDQLNATVKAFKLRTLAELKVLLLVDHNMYLVVPLLSSLTCRWSTGRFECLDLVRMCVQAGRHW